jgi:twinkle protein|tara:strand:- start:25 stop:927 length:903 start_codon:yes stop_codon:yes gene_type:complete
MNTGDVVRQLTVTKEQVVAEGYYETTEDFKIKSTDNLYDDVIKYYNEEKNSGYSMGWRKTDPDFLVRKGEVTCITGSSGSGKSMILSQILLHLMNYTKVLVASMEMRPVLQIARMIQQKGMTDPTDQYIREFCDEYKDRLYIYDQQSTTSEDDLYASIHYGKHVLGCDVMVIDSLMKVDSVSEEDYGAQKQFVNRLSCIARDLNIHIFLVAHTKKMDESTIPDATHILGSSHIRNLVDNILCVWRNREHERLNSTGDLPEDRKTEPTALLLVQKQRNHTYEGTFGFWFDIKTLTYKERPL